MSYFLSAQPLRLGQPAILTGPEAGHVLLSRRIKKGQAIVLQDSTPARYLCQVTAISKRQLTVLPEQVISIPPELPRQIVLFQAFVAEKALDFILQKSTELGASKVVLFNAQNTATRLTSEMVAQKNERWQKILWEAAKQCDRGYVPELAFVPNVDELMALAGACRIL